MLLFDFQKNEYSCKLLTEENALQEDELLVKLVLSPVSKFRKCFFDTYYLFAKIRPLTLLQTLLQLYNEPNIKFDSTEDLNKIFDNGTQPLDSLIRENIIFLIKKWMGKFIDFYDFPELIPVLQLYIQDNQNKLQSTIVSQLEVYQSQKLKFESHIPHQYMDNITISNFSILNSKLSPEFVVQQVTLYEYQLISSIRAREFLVPKYKFHPDRNLSNFISHFTRMRNAIISELQSSESKSNALILLKNAIILASISIEYSNYNFAMEILSALYNPAIFTNDKLKLWDSLEDGYYSKFQELIQFFSPEDNYSTYINSLSSCEPNIPYLAVHLGDLRNINRFTRTYSHNRINLFKLSKLTTTLSSFTLIPGKCKYKFDKDTEFRQKLITHLESVVDKDLYPLKNNAIIEEDSRLGYLRMVYEEIFSDAMLLTNEEFTFADHKMRSRDWSLLTSRSTVKSFAPGELITIDSHEHIYILLEGSVEVNKEGMTLSVQKGPTILNHSELLDIFSPLIFYAETQCEVSIMERELLESILNSDSLLPIRFYITLSNSLMDLFKSSNCILERRNSWRMIPTSSSVQRTVLLRKMTANLSSAVERALKRDQELRAIFSWKEDEVVIKELKAVFSGKLEKQGSLFITQRYICFYAKIFSHKSKVVIAIDKIQSIRSQKQKLIIKIERKKKLIFKVYSGLEETLRLIDRLMKSLKENNIANITPTNNLPLNELMKQKITRCIDSSELHVNLKRSKYTMHEKDWRLLLQGAKRRKFQKNDIIIDETDESQHIFQLINGSCSILHIGERRNKAELGTIDQTGEVFGEVNFFQKENTSSVIVIAVSDEVDTLVIDPFYLKRLFYGRPEFACKFMKEICITIGKRVGVRAFETKEEREVDDIIIPQLYCTIDKFPVRIASNALIHQLSGPLLNSDDQSNYAISSARDYVAASSISTYPLRKYEIDSEIFIKQDGSPICDQYRALIYENKMIMAMADGCNWGEAPREAAERASSAFVHYLADHLEGMFNTQRVASLVQRAFSFANNEILKGKDISEEMVGTTTLVGGILIELDGHFQPPSPDHSDINFNNNNNNTSNINTTNTSTTTTTNNNNNNTINNSKEEEENRNEERGEDNIKKKKQWGFIYGSLGDCKIFHWSSVTGQFSDITKNNRNVSLNASDCGGRLGPYLSDNLPDLRNFELGLFHCYEDDILLFLSDGVHDNLDPKSLGFTPRDIGLPDEKWKSISDYLNLEELKTEFRLCLLEKIIYQEISVESLSSLLDIRPRLPRSSLPSPLEIVNLLLSYCSSVCSASSKWMQDNPNENLPKDYKKFPGKMDHTSCLCVRVNHLSSVL